MQRVSRSFLQIFAEVMLVPGPTPRCAAIFSEISELSSGAAEHCTSQLLSAPLGLRNTRLTKGSCQCMSIHTVLLVFLASPSMQSQRNPCSACLEVLQGFTFMYSENHVSTSGWCWCRANNAVIRKSTEGLAVGTLRNTTPHRPVK